MCIYICIICICRSYYRCTNPKCAAKKQVERSRDDPDSFIITYEGLHLHFAYSFFHVDQQQQEMDSGPLNKKQKRRISSDGQAAVYEMMNESGPNSYPLIGTTGEFDSEQELQERRTDDYSEIQSQGLLEDIVPLLIRKPFIASSSSSHLSSPPTSPSTISWSPEDSPDCSLAVRNIKYTNISIN